MDTGENAQKRKLTRRNLALWTFLLVICTILEIVIHLPATKGGLDSGAVPVEYLCIFNDEIVLEPGERKDLKIGVYPEDADKDSLQRVSSSPGLVWVEGWEVIAQSGWQEETDHTATIIVQLGNAVHDEAHVTVQKPSTALPGSDITESMGYGKVQD